MKAEFNGILRASASESNPLQSVIEFVFTDFQPNKNRQGVTQAEAVNIIRSGLNQPVKVNFLGEEVAAHKGAIPIGPIIELKHDDDKVIGKAIIWKDIYADFVTYLEKASASEGGVQFSWELYYRSSNTDGNGIQWLENVEVAGIAIVDDPAYSGRTPLLSFAESRDKASKLSEQIAEFVGGQMDPSYEALQAQVAELTDKMYVMINQLYEALSEAAPDPAPADVESVMAEFVNLLSRLKSGKEESSAQAESLQSELDGLRTEVQELRTFKQDTEASAALAELTSTRKAALSAVMSEEDFAEKLEFILGLSQDQFEVFVASLQTVRNKSTSSVNDKKSNVPLPDLTSQNTDSEPKQITITDISNAWRKYRSAS